MKSAIPDRGDSLDSGRELNRVKETRLIECALKAVEPRIFAKSK
jgi:hypothetical protein